ncbi:class I adenylate-forming enzyme family protein [Saccharothrix yanglingensis]|uniref:AMP-dependent synthetase n=1 Tax=Saccharothrix yanglingensis TaxID=659496 RepID=A0ABU0WYS5_9PSEU|nr:fatty acid--CoA ligase family protein [Saccharothrix yanglingensis]MDQ2585022.1 AMP-dependent synthetase [Saccharothrix yanglingensis]
MSEESVFPQALLDELARDPAAPAVERGPRTTTRGELLDLVRRTAAALRDAGAGPGRGVALATGVTAEGLAAQVAAHVLGCRVVGVRPAVPPAHLPHVLGDVDVLVVDAGTDDPALRGAAGAARVVVLEHDLPADGDDPVPAGRPDDVALVVSTSGSTGVPKGAAFTYAALTGHWSWQPARWTDRTRALAAGYGRFLLFGTLASAVVFEHLALCLLTGGTAVVPEGPPDLPRDFGRLRATACLLTVPRLHRLLDTASPDDLTTLRVLLVAGSPLAPHRFAQAVELLGDVVHHGYGQTELGMVSLLTAEDVRRHPGALASVGRPWAGVEVRVVDEDGADVPPGATGEVVVRTANAFLGYWRDPDRTAEVVRDGWVRTRDLGRLDGDGFLHLTGRARDVVIVNAVLHYVGPIEKVLVSHPDVDQAYVVGAPDERTGEAAHAFVVPRAGASPDGAALRALVAVELGPDAVPATVTTVAEVPIAPSGKPDKRALLALRPEAVRGV